MSLPVYQRIACSTHRRQVYRGGSLLLQHGSLVIKYSGAPHRFHVVLVHEATHAQGALANQVAVLSLCTAPAQVPWSLLRRPYITPLCTVCLIWEECTWEECTWRCSTGMVPLRSLGAQYGHDWMAYDSGLCLGMSFWDRSLNIPSLAQVSLNIPSLAQVSLNIPSLASS